jgi:hypothetical protein
MRPPAQEVEFTHPVLARQPGPVVVPPALRRLLPREVLLAVRVAVDDTGRVTDLYPMNELTKVEESLWQSYSPALRSWEFEPAKRNGIPVHGEIILRFRVMSTRHGAGERQ